MQHTSSRAPSPKTRWPASSSAEDSSLYPIGQQRLLVPKIQGDGHIGVADAKPLGLLKLERVLQGGTLHCILNACEFGIALQLSAYYEGKSDIPIA